MTKKMSCDEALNTLTMSIIDRAQKNARLQSILDQWSDDSDREAAAEKVFAMCRKWDEFSKPMSQLAVHDGARRSALREVLVRVRQQQSVGVKPADVYATV